MSQQLSLPLQLPDYATFKNFCPGENQALLSQLHTFLDSTDVASLYLTGPAGSGKSHLLQASCHHAVAQGMQTVYLSLPQVQEYGVGLLQGFDQLDLVCIDDVHVVAGDHAWEVALFHLFNGLTQSGGHLLMAADGRPNDLPWQLADLKSRLSWGGVFRLRELDDEQKLTALALRLRNRGLDLPSDVGRYMLTHLPRDMGSLFSFVDRLDQASLVAQRRLTIPFIRSLLNA